ncbi:MAG: TonB-dependent receptor, partial [Bryobacteraceae bacterium]
HNEIGRNQGKVFESQFGIPGTETNPDLATWPTFNVTGYSFPSEGRTIQYWNGTIQLQNSLIIQRGAHSIKLGGMGMRLFTFDANCTCVGSYGFNGTYTSRQRGQATGDAFAQFLLGTPSSLSRAVQTDRAYIYGHQFAAFVQDDWRVNSRLTVNIGLRYDYMTSFKEKQDRIASWDPVTGEVIYPETANLRVFDATTRGYIPYNAPFAIRRSPNRGLIDPDNINFGPRIGFAYQLRPNLVMRGGYGIFNIMTSSRPAILSNFNPPFMFTLAQVVNPDTPNFTWDQGFNGARTNTAIGFWRAGELTNRKNGYNQNWNYGFQYALRADMMVEASYVGAGGRHLDQLRTLNVPQPGPGILQNNRPFPNVGAINDFYLGARSSYHSLQMKFVKRFTDGLAINVAYTRSKSIDTQSTDTGSGGDISGTENPFNLVGSMRGVSAFDLPQRLVVNYVWEIPFGRTKKYLNTGVAAHLLGGWQLTGILSTQSGYPFTPSATSVTNNGTGGRPNRLCDGRISSPSLDRWFDTTCFVSPTIYTYGNSGRNILRADPYTNFDTGVYRNFNVPKLGESGQLQFRAEFYNLFNHPNFGLPVRSINAANRGVVTVGLPPRLIQFGLKLRF